MAPSPPDPFPRQLGAILTVLGLDWKSLFEPWNAGENRNKVIAWLYRVLDTLDSKTGHLLGFVSLNLSAQTFLAGILVKDNHVPGPCALLILGLLLVPLTTAISGFRVFLVNWKFFGNVQDKDGNQPIVGGIEKELVELAMKCDERIKAHQWAFYGCVASAGAFFITLVIAFYVFGASPASPGQPAVAWKFAVSGDSRNCGDIVMPAIAAGLHADGAKFYWHLGDFRFIYQYDEDMVPPAALKLPPNPISLNDYRKAAWPDFIAHQMSSFGNLPVYLSMGNHETAETKTRQAWITQFTNWLDQPTIRAQRLKDDPQASNPRSYYHWIQGNIDFITLDNASNDQFDTAQLDWFHALIQRDEASSEIRTIVVGMHAALPGSIGRSHSMGDWPQGVKSGRDVYETLWHAQDSAHKRVYILASHSHFFMKNVYQTADWKNKVLPGWIVGTAGAVRYRVPSQAGPIQEAKTDVYGYMIGTVATDGSISFEFQELTADDLLAAAHGTYPDALVQWCYKENRDLTPPP